MYDKDGFNRYFAHEVKASANTCATYRSFLNRIDDAIGGLDETLARQGLEDVMSWAKDAEVEPFLTYRSHARSVLKRYATYKLGKLAGGEVDGEVVDAEVGDTIEVDLVEADANFIREKEMQVQVRRQLGGLEEGLQAIDDGIEVQVPTGRIDILARDSRGTMVVLELKAGRCPSGALEQLLGYAYDIEQERGIVVRTILVAGSFTDRQRAAAKRAGVEVLTYAYSLSFQKDA